MRTTIVSFTVCTAKLMVSFHSSICHTNLCESLVGIGTLRIFVWMQCQSSFLIRGLGLARSVLDGQSEKFERLSQLHKSDRSSPHCDARP